MKGIITKKGLALLAIVMCLMVAGGLYFAYRSFYTVPRSRLAANEIYPEMPEDDFHHYIDLPIDHSDLKRGTFRGFYLFSPNFYQRKNITFLLTDGQMELVSLETDFSFFENVLNGGSYVLIGVRGHSPTLLPEVFKDGQIDYDQALNLYGSDQQVEDIENVRLDLINKGFIPPEGKVKYFWSVRGRGFGSTVCFKIRGEREPCHSRINRSP